MRFAPGLSLALLLLTAASCSVLEDSEPQEIGLLVTNTTCAGDVCTPIRVRAFPDNQPLWPGGPWSIDLGVVSTRTACLKLPATSEAHLNRGEEGSRTWYWTTARGTSLGSQDPGDGWPWASSSTPSFVPADAEGWRVSLPGDGAPVPSGPCTP